jgi:hypothetical protein
LNKRQTYPSPNWHFEHLGMRAKKLDHPTIFIQIQDLQGETQLTLNFGGKTSLTLPFFSPL